ncbi:Hypothetical protein PMT_2550 [Prochlorococcus marinus str. MIT 9313]|uniref:Uncharacterized protein n=1 Tax=Prochlorococcus marinus (strain MIT 9313) TaxID=74547 RepID=B9ERL4_PROMM|nr:Hypothetical protein PMT_2444 [Prochlorococcus marinus str. MIT 9313]CAX32069.1 Hypothetical protein PMT_2550 [Prochlorococcus marinus str. MIT 9313]
MRGLVWIACEKTTVVKTAGSILSIDEYKYNQH